MNKLVSGAVFAIYFTLPLVALSALPVARIDGELTTLLALPPRTGGYANDPILGVVENLGLEGRLLHAARIYVGVLAATILFIATNAGVSAPRASPTRWRPIGSCRRSSARPTPATRRRGFARGLRGDRADPRDPPPAASPSSGRSTRLARPSRSRSPTPRSSACGRRTARSRAPLPGEAEPTHRRVAWPIFAFAGGIATGISFLVLVVQNPLTRWVGLGWSSGSAAMSSTAAASCVSAAGDLEGAAGVGPALALEYRRLLVAVVPGPPSDAAMDLACRLATERARGSSR